MSSCVCGVVSAWLFGSWVCDSLCCCVCLVVVQVVLLGVSVGVWVGMCSCLYVAVCKRPHVSSGVCASVFCVFLYVSVCLVSVSVSVCVLCLVVCVCVLYVYVGLCKGVLQCL